jgi:hypothetical protein
MSTELGVSRETQTDIVKLDCIFIDILPFTFSNYLHAGRYCGVSKSLASGDDRNKPTELLGHELGLYYRYANREFKRISLRYFEIVPSLAARLILAFCWSAVVGGLQAHIGA